MGLSPEQIGSIADRGLAIKRLMGTEAGRLFSQKFETGREARITEDEDLRIAIAQGNLGLRGQEFALNKELKDARLDLIVQQSAGAKQGVIDAQMRVDTIEQLMAQGDPMKQRTMEAIAGVPAVQRPISQVPAERLEFSKQQHGATLERALTTTGDKGVMREKNSSVADDWNSAYGIAESAMYVWSTKGRNHWEKIQLPRGLTYKQVEVSARAIGKTPHEWLKEANIVE